MRCRRYRSLLPYSVVLLQLRVFYARQQPWIPIAIIVVITIVKIAGSLVAPHLTDNPDLVAGYLGLANGLGFVAGAVTVTSCCVMRCGPTEVIYLRWPRCARFWSRPPRRC